MVAKKPFKWSTFLFTIAYLIGVFGCLVFLPILWANMFSSGLPYGVILLCIVLAVQLPLFWMNRKEKNPFVIQRLVKRPLTKKEIHDKALFVKERKDAFLYFYNVASLLFASLFLLNASGFLLIFEVINRFTNAIFGLLTTTYFFLSVSAIGYFSSQRFAKITKVAPWVELTLISLVIVHGIVGAVAYFSEVTMSSYDWWVGRLLVVASVVYALGLLFFSTWLLQRIKASEDVKRKATKIGYLILSATVLCALLLAGLFVPAAEPLSAPMWKGLLQITIFCAWIWIAIHLVKKLKN